MKTHHPNALPHPGKKSAFLQHFLLLPPAFLLILWPFIVHSERVLTNLSKESWYPPLSVSYDYFMKCRGQVFCIVALLMLIPVVIHALLFCRKCLSAAVSSQRHMVLSQATNVSSDSAVPVVAQSAAQSVSQSAAQSVGSFASSLLNQRTISLCTIGMRTILFLLLPFLFFLWALLSAQFSSHSFFSFEGMLESYETVWVIGGYIVVFYYCYILAGSVWGRKGLLYSAVIGAFLQGLIGVSQIMGHDFWNSKAGMFLIFFGQEQQGEIRFRFTSQDPIQAYLSFYNPNHAAIYLILMIPLMVMAVRCCRHLWAKIFCAVTAVLLIISLYGTRSKAGLAVLVFLLLLYGLMHIRNRRKKRAVICILLFLGIAGMALLLNTAGDSPVLPESIVKQVRKVFRKEKAFRLSDITATEDGISYIYDNKLYYFGTQDTASGMQCYARDESGTPVRLILNDDGTYHTENNKKGNIRLSAYLKDSDRYIKLTCNTCSWTFIKRKEDTHFFYINSFNRTDMIEPAQTAFPTTYDRWFTNRVYIWNRTLPLLKDTLLLGTGPDTFAVVFPQKDYVIRGQVDDNLLSEILTKPHSFYLQTALQEGMPALLFFLILIIGTIRKLSRARKGPSPVGSCLIGIELALIGFMFMALSNDGILPVMPYVWGVIGAGAGYAMKSTD